MRIVRALLVGLALTTAVAACGNKEEEARKEAEAKAAEAAKAAKEAQEKAAKEEAEAQAKIAKANGEIKAKLQKDIDAAGRKATYLKEKAAKATGAAKKNADAAVAELDARDATAKSDLAKLDAATGDAFNTAKNTVEADIAALNKAVDSLETTLKGK